MVMFSLDSGFWSQNRLFISATISSIVLLLLIASYALYKKRTSIGALAQSPRTPILIKLFQFALGGSAILALIASVIPRHDPEAGILLYLFLWPLIGFQIVVACLAWEKYIQRSPWGTMVAALFVAFCAFQVDLLMFKLTKYL